MSTRFSIYKIDNGWILEVSWLTGSTTHYYKTWKQALNALMEFEPE